MKPLKEGNLILPLFLQRDATWRLACDGGSIRRAVVFGFLLFFFFCSNNKGTTRPQDYQPGFRLSQLIPPGFGYLVVRLDSRAHQRNASCAVSSFQCTEPASCLYYRVQRRPHFRARRCDHLDYLGNWLVHSHSYSPAVCDATFVHANMATNPRPTLKHDATSSGWLAINNSSGPQSHSTVVSSHALLVGTAAGHNISNIMTVALDLSWLRCVSLRNRQSLGCRCSSSSQAWRVRVVPHVEKGSSEACLSRMVLCRLFYQPSPCNLLSCLIASRNSGVCFHRLLR